MPGCARGIEFEVAAADLIVADRDRRQKHVERARIVLLSADGVGTLSIMRKVGCEGDGMAVAGTLHSSGSHRTAARQEPAAGQDAAAQAVVVRVVDRTLGEPPGEATHWTGRAMAAAAGISLRSVQRIWAAHGLQPHRVKRFKLSKAPEFAAKLQDIVGMDIDPPAHAIVLSVDEKSQIQALDRTQPAVPIKQGKAGTLTFDYKRHGTTPCSPPSAYWMAP